MITRFGLAMLVARLEKERSYDLCVRVALALGYSLVEKSEAFHLDVPGSRFLSVYFSKDALVDDLLEAGESVLSQL